MRTIPIARVSISVEKALGLDLYKEPLRFHLIDIAGDRVIKKIRAAGALNTWTGKVRLHPGKKAFVVTIYPE